MFRQAYADKDMFIWQTNIGPNESISTVYVANIDDKNTVMSGVMSNFSGKMVLESDEVGFIKLKLRKYIGFVGKTMYFLIIQQKL